jgi:hypothetical protein
MFYTLPMNFFNTILAIGIPSIIAALIYIGRKLQVLDTVGHDVIKVKDKVGEIDTRLIVVESNLANLSQRFGGVENKVDLLWKAAK